MSTSALVLRTIRSKLCARARPRTPAQEHIVEACDTIAKYECDLDPGCGNTGLLVKPGSVICPIEEFRAWYNATHGVLPITAEGVSRAEFTLSIKEFRTTRKPKSDPTGSWEKLIGVVQGDLKYIIVQAKFNVYQLQESQTTKKALAKKVDALVELISEQPAGVNVTYGTFEFVWIALATGLLRGMVVGLAIAFPCAWLTLLKFEFR